VQKSSQELNLPGTPVLRNFLKALGVQPKQFPRINAQMSQKVSLKFFRSPDIRTSVSTYFIDQSLFGGCHEERTLFPKLYEIYTDAVRIERDRPIREAAYGG
jgi:hypothetical protein